MFAGLSIKARISSTVKLEKRKVSTISEANRAHSDRDVFRLTYLTILAVWWVVWP